MENRDDIIADLLLRWEESFEHGDDVPARELCDDHPELVDEVQSKIDDLKKMAWMNQDAEESGDELPDELLSKILGDRYRIESLIAQGGYGRVFKAFDPELERHVAVKVPAKHGESNGQVDSLVEEARRVAKLRHPGIVAVHDVGREDSVYFIVSELIEGKNLSEVIARKRPSIKEAVLLVAEIAENLEAAHIAGFVHRDIKPANILIDENGKPLITDFGIASTHEAAEETVTKGTLPYMAPEQIANEKQLIDQRADIYSLGVVLYEMLTGESPYSARTPGTLREQILFRSPKPIPDSVLPSVQKVCLKSLSKHPADRFDSAEEFSSALRHSLTTIPTKDSRRYRWLALFVAGALLVAGGFLAGQFFDDEDHSVVQSSVEGGITLNGTRRIVTPIMNTAAPITIEVWVAPSTNDNSESQFVVGSDVPGHYGIGLGMGANGHPMVEIIRSGLDATRYRLPTNRWSHLAAVFSFDETRLYLDGKLIGTCLPTVKAEVESPFVVGNLGFDHGKMCFLGKLRSVRITSGERFNEEFLPDENFSIGDNSESLLIYDESSFGSKHIEDLSGNGNHGNWDSVVVIE